MRLLGLIVVNQFPSQSPPDRFPHSKSSAAFPYGPSHNRIKDALRNCKVSQTHRTSKIGGLGDASKTQKIYPFSLAQLPWVSASSHLLSVISQGTHSLIVSLNAVYWLVITIVYSLPTALSSMAQLSSPELNKEIFVLEGILSHTIWCTVWEDYWMIQACDAGTTVSPPGSYNVGPAILILMFESNDPWWESSILCMAGCLLTFLSVPTRCLLKSLHHPLLWPPKLPVDTARILCDAIPLHLRVGHLDVFTSKQLCVHVE